MSDEAKKRLMGALPHISLAMEMARMQEPEGKVSLAVIVKKSDGSGRMTASFEGEEFIKDIITLLGFKDLNELTMSEENGAAEEVSR